MIFTATEFESFFLVVFVQSHGHVDLTGGDDANEDGLLIDGRC